MIVECLDLSEFAVPLFHFFEGGYLSIEDIIGEFWGSVSKLNVGSFSILFRR